MGFVWLGRGGCVGCSGLVFVDLRVTGDSGAGDI